MDSSFLFKINNFGGVTGYNFQIKIVFLSLMIVFVLENSVDTDELPPNVAFHLGLHYFPKYPLRNTGNNFHIKMYFFF